MYNKYPPRLTVQEIITLYGRENFQWKVTQYDMHGSELDSVVFKLYGITNVELDGKTYLAMANEYVWHFTNILNTGRFWRSFSRNF